MAVYQGLELKMKLKPELNLTFKEKLIIYLKINVLI
jgi:hypothetical protein